MSAVSAICCSRLNLLLSSLSVELYMCHPQGTLRPPSGERCDGVDVRAVLRANQAVRLGLRAASRNPELSFGKTLLDAMGSLLSMLPWLSALILIAAVAGRLEPLLGLAAAAVALGKMRWALAGGALAAAAISWTMGMAFWAGALPVLAADAELQRRPPPGHFWPLAARGFARARAAARGRSRLRRRICLARGGAARRAGGDRRRRGGPHRSSSRAAAGSSRAGRIAAAGGDRGAAGDRRASRSAAGRREEMSAQRRPARAPAT